MEPKTLVMPMLSIGESVLKKMIKITTIQHITTLANALNQKQ
jgi:hypothetical protein